MLATAVARASRLKRGCTIPMVEMGNSWCMGGLRSRRTIAGPQTWASCLHAPTMRWGQRNLTFSSSSSGSSTGLNGNSWRIWKRSLPPSRLRIRARMIGRAMVRRRDLRMLFWNIEYSLSTAAGHASFVLLAVSYGFSSIVGLRLLAVFAGTLMIAFNYWHPHGRPLWLPLRWNILFIAINVMHLLYIFEEDTRVRFMSPIMRRIFNEIFEPAGLDRVAFSKLSRIGKIVAFQPGSHLCYEGAPNSEVMLVISGSADVHVRGQRVYNLSAGQFIGEMGIHVGFHMDKPMNSGATVTARTSMKCLSWKRDKLIRLLESDLAISRALQNAISADLIHKLNASQKAPTALQSEYDKRIEQGRVQQQLEHKAVHLYSGLLQNVLESGSLAVHERNMLARYRMVHNISQDAHCSALKRLGWSQIEFEAGRKAERGAGGDKTHSEGRSLNFMSGSKSNELTMRETQEKYASSSNDFG